MQGIGSPKSWPSSETGLGVVRPHGRGADPLPTIAKVRGAHLIGTTDPRREYDEARA